MRVRLGRRVSVLFKVGGKAVLGARAPVRDSVGTGAAEGWRRVPLAGGGVREGLWYTSPATLTSPERQTHTSPSP